MPIERTTSQNQGTVGNSQAIGTFVTGIGSLPPGRYKVWGNCRHTLADGVRLIATGQPSLIIANAATASQSFGPVVMDLTAASNAVSLELQLATGASDTAGGNIYAQRINQ